MFMTAESLKKMADDCVEIVGGMIKHSNLTDVEAAKFRDRLVEIRDSRGSSQDGTPLRFGFFKVLKIPVYDDNQKLIAAIVEDQQCRHELRTMFVTMLSGETPLTPEEIEAAVFARAETFIFKDAK